MIAHLSGNLIFKSIDSLTVDVGGVGYEVFAPLSTFYVLPEEGEDVNLLIYTHVKEDAIKLFGFLQSREKEVFIKLLSVSGIGPKLALNILSGIEVDDFLNSLRRDDLARINAIPGVGKKTAERLLLELKDKIKLEPLTEGEAAEAPAAAAGDHFDDALSAMVNLGYKKPEVEKALAQLATEEREWSVESLIKESLKALSKKK